MDPANGRTSKMWKRANKMAAILVTLPGSYFHSYQKVCFVYQPSGCSGLVNSFEQKVRVFDLRLGSWQQSWRWRNVLRETELICALTFGLVHLTTRWFGTCDRVSNIFSTLFWPQASASLRLQTDRLSALLCYVFHRKISKSLKLSQEFNLKQSVAIIWLVHVFVEWLREAIYLIICY